MKNNNNYSTSPPVVSNKYSQRIRKPTARLIDNQLNETNSRVTVRPYIVHVICRNDCSPSVMTNESNHNISTVSHTSKVARRRRMF